MKKTHEQFLENLILKSDRYRNGEFLYIPSKEFGGMYECFSNLKNY